MRIDELDEFQGLTLDMVHAWLTKYKWVAQETRGSVAILRWWAAPREDKFGVWIPCELAGTMTQYAGMALAVLADEFGMSVQDFLREINPRMRKGMPSQAARNELGHDGGTWIACRGELGNGGTIVFVCFASDSDDGLPLAVWDFDEWEQWEVAPVEIENEWSFWPCDEHGNKVRWPEENGVML